MPPSPRPGSTRATSCSSSSPRRSRRRSPEARGPDWLGLQVTAPYKRLVAGLCDEVEPAAATIGAVNSVVRAGDAGGLVGFNTDAPGFRAGVELAMGRPLVGCDVVVAGAGGAAHAVVFACLDAGARRSRSATGPRAAAAELAQRLADVGSGSVSAVGLDGSEFAAALRRRRPGRQRHDGRHARAGLDHRRRPAAGGRDGLRPRLRATRDPAPPRGAGPRPAGGNGSEMLIQQAAIAFERWTGVAGMADVMRAAVAPLLADRGARA